MHQTAVQQSVVDRRRTALIVDDNLLVAWCFTEIFSRAGFRALQAGSGEEALGVLQDIRVDVLLTDLRLPDIDGIAVAEAAKALNPGACLLLMSSFADDATRAEAARIGIASVLEKPIDITQLGEFIALR